MATPFPRARILIIDDEPANVRLLERLLAQNGYSQLASTSDSREAASMAAEFAPDLILLDLHMPHRDGFAVLEELEPLMRGNYLPVLVLTADVTRDSRERALSSGARDFLTKPLDATEVSLRIRNLLETRFLYLEERVLRDETLRGSIRALTDVLALVNPEGFSRAVRARKLVVDLISHLGAGPRWEVEIAAMLSQLGVVTLPPETVRKLYYGETLSTSESIAVLRLPEIASRVVVKIPRLEEVALILEHQNQRYDGRGASADPRAGEAIPWGARVLKLVLDVDTLDTRGLAPNLVIDTLREREGWYDPELVAALAEMRKAEQDTQHVEEIDLLSVQPGMILAEDVKTLTGMLLVARGHEVSARLVERLLGSAHLFPPRPRVHVILPGGGPRETPMTGAG